MNGVSEEMAQLPHFLTVACTFFPIMDILPRKVTQDNGDVALIANTQVPFLNTATLKLSPAQQVQPITLPPPVPPVPTTITAPNFPSLPNLNGPIQRPATQ